MCYEGKIVDVQSVSFIFGNGESTDNITKWGKIRIVCRMEVKLGGWSRRPMPRNVEGQFKVIRGHPRSNSLILWYGHET